MTAANRRPARSAPTPSRHWVWLSSRTNRAAQITFIDPVDDADKPLAYLVGDSYIGVTIGDFRVLFRGDSLDQSVDLAESVLRKTLDAIHESWPQ